MYGHDEKDKKTQFVSRKGNNLFHMFLVLLGMSHILRALHLELTTPLFDYSFVFIIAGLDASVS